MSEPLFTPQEQAIILRGERLRILVQQEGWRDLVLISKAIVDAALHELTSYPGTDDHHTASLANIWKTLKSHHEKLVATVKHQIQEGLTTAMKHHQPQQSGDAEEFAGVIPFCDIESREGVTAD